MKRYVLYITGILSILLTVSLIFTNCKNIYNPEKEPYVVTAEILVIIPEPDPEFTQELVSYNELRKSIVDIRQSRSVASEEYEEIAAIDAWDVEEEQVTYKLPAV
jgi:hypothetical protein